MTESNGGSTIRSVSRALALLRSFKPGIGALSLQELAREAGVPKSTAVRLLDTLRTEGMVLHNPRDRTYSPGFGLLHWSQVAHDQWGVPNGVLDLMRSAATESGESISLYARVGDARIALAHVPGPQSLRHVITPGVPMTLAAGASSWILLQSAEAEVIERVQRTMRAQGSREYVRTLVARSVQQGYAFSDGEREVGVAAVSVRVDDNEGVLLAALTFGGPNTRFTPDKVRKYAVRLRELAAQIGPELASTRRSARME